MRDDKVEGHTSISAMDAEEAAKQVVRPSVLMNSTVVVAGATGLIGSHIVSALHALNDMSGMHIHIVAAARNTDRLEALFGSLDDVACVRCDVTSLPSCQQLYESVRQKAYSSHLFVIDAASPSSPHLYAQKPVETMLSNIYGVANLLNASGAASHAHDSDSERVVFLYLSSSEVYGKRRGWHLMTESEPAQIDPTDSRSCYPSAKLAAETLLVSMREEYGIDVRIVRPSHVFGPGFLPTDDRVGADFFSRAVAGKPIKLRSAGADRRTMIYVSDCVSGILSVLTSGKAGQAYNVTNTDNLVSLRDFSELIARQGNVAFSAPDSHTGESSSDGQALQRATALSDQRLRSLGWKPRIGLADGISRTFQALR